MEDTESKHDSYNDKEYKKRCECQKCVAMYDEWCKTHKDDARTSCKRKCVTICKIECEQRQVHNKEWGYTKEYEGKWEHFNGKTHEPEKSDRNDRDDHKDRKDRKKHDKKDKKDRKHKKECKCDRCDRRQY